MSYPIQNYIKVISEKETFESIVALLIDEQKEETTYEKFWAIPDGLSERENYEWREENYQCTKGIYADRIQQAISFETNFYPAVRIIEYIACLFPEARLEYGYDQSDDEEHEIFDVYENGILVSREDTIITYDDEE